MQRNYVENRRKNLSHIYFRRIRTYHTRNNRRKGSQASASREIYENRAIGESDKSVLYATHSAAGQICGKKCITTENAEKLHGEPPEKPVFTFISEEYGLTIPGIIDTKAVGTRIHKDF